MRINISRAAVTHSPKAAESRHSAGIKYPVLRHSESSACLIMADRSRAMGVCVIFLPKGMRLDFPTADDTKKPRQRRVP